MKWLKDLWTTSSDAAKIALVIGFVAVLGLALFFLGNLDAVGGWLGTN